MWLVKLWYGREQFVVFQSAVFLLFFALFISVPLAFAGAADRVVVEVNRVAYTQRQVEVFYFVRGVIDGIDASSRGFDHEQWHDVLQQFTAAMLVEQEAQRLGSFMPTRRAIEAARIVYEQHLEANAVSAAMARRLEITGRTLTQTLTNLLRIEAFLLSRRRQGISHREIADELWFTEIKERSLIRFFDDAKIYVRLGVE